jgi:hypothetical protein
VTRIATGKLLAAVLEGSWRRSPRPSDFSSVAWGTVGPRLLQTGAAGLGWWRLRNSHQRTSSVGQQLQQAYRFQTLCAALMEDRLQQVLAHCRASGVEPLVDKGWAVGRLYPEPGLRPSGDIDLFVGPGQHKTAVALLAGPAGHWNVDLHQGIPELADRSLDDLYARSQLVQLGEMQVRIPGAEDQLRHLCLHLLKHGAWRPLWLCDIAVALELRPARFDWDCCLRGSRREAEAVACAIGLAHQLLGVDVAETPVASRAKCLPPWLVPTVLRQWATPYMRYTDRPMANQLLTHPVNVVRAARRRWPNSIEATVSMGGPFNSLPRLPFQLGDCLVRLCSFVAQLSTGLLRWIFEAALFRRTSRDGHSVGDRPTAPAILSQDTQPTDDGRTGHRSRSPGPAARLPT